MMCRVEKLKGGVVASLMLLAAAMPALADQGARVAMTGIAAAKPTLPATHFSSVRRVLRCRFTCSTATS
jgi:hypothetical protein